MRIATVLSTGVLLLAAASSGVSQERRSIEDFVLAIHTDGISYAEAREYSAEDLDKLFELLGDEQHAQFWPNITKVIGIVGGDPEVARLIAFVRGGHVDVDPSATAVLRGRVSAVSSVGYLARNAESRDALEYLLGGVDHGVWLDADRAPWLICHKHPHWASVRLGTSAVRGLAISGQPKALDKLYGLADGEASDDRIRQTAVSVLAALGEAHPTSVQR